MSTIYKIAENLKNTIAGKEAYMAELQKKHIKAFESVDAAAISATIEFLKININELKVILFDVEKACQEHSLMSWEVNPERMGQ